MHAKTGKKHYPKPYYKHIAHILSHGREHIVKWKLCTKRVQLKKEESQTAL